jgi:predicted permease
LKGIFLRDLRYALRRLLKTPSFSLPAMLTLAIAIGACVAMFTILQGTLFRRLPFAAADRVVALSLETSNGEQAWIPYSKINVWQRHTKSITSMGFYSDTNHYLQFDDVERPIAFVESNADMMRVLRTNPQIGRYFSEDEQAPGKGNVLIVSDSLWRSMFHASNDILNQSVKVDGILYTIVGVMPPKFIFPVGDKLPQVWAPLQLRSVGATDVDNSASYRVIGRLRDGITTSTAAAELQTIDGNQLSFGQKPQRESTVFSKVKATLYRDMLTGNTKQALLALSVAVGMVWLIACVNVANLMLARSATIQREVALRTALGASRVQTLKNSFLESLLLSMLSAGAGLGLSKIVLYIYRDVVVERLNASYSLHLDWPLASFLIVTTVVSAIGFGILPVMIRSTVAIDQVLRSGTHQSSIRQYRWQQLLIVLEVTLSFVFLFGCGLMLKTVYALRNVPLGFRTDHILIVNPILPSYKYQGIDINRLIWQPLVERLKYIHTVKAVSLTTEIPLDHSSESKITFYPKDASGGTLQKAEGIDAELQAVSPDLQKVFQFKMFQGRFFTDQDIAISAPVVVVNRAFANAFAPHQDITENFVLNLGNGRLAHVVGVVDDTHQFAIDVPSVPEIYLCDKQLRANDKFYDVTLGDHIQIAIRINGRTNDVMPDIRKMMKRLNPDLQASGVRMMDEVVDDSIGNQLLVAHLLDVFGGLALLISVTGLYGLLNYLVGQRTREVGIRIALGAQRSGIVWLVVRQASVMLLPGIAFGVALSICTAHILASILFMVRPYDLGALLASSAILIVCGLLASFIPAVRLSSVDPVNALRSE